MADQYQRRERVGYGTKVKNSVGGVVVGLIFALGSLVLLWWNEGRTVERSRALAEGASAVLETDPAAVDPNKDGQLVHVAARATAADAVDDALIGVSADALALAREVEMYQWREKKETREEKRAGGSTERITTYSYDKTWDEDAIDSSRFDTPGGHENPGDWPFRSEEFHADGVQLGAYGLAPEIVGGFDGWNAMGVSQVGNLPDGFRIEDGKLLRGGSAGAPRVGDIRVSYRVVPEGDYSVVAKQAAGTLSQFVTPGGREVLLVESGIVPSKEMFARAEQRNSLLAWLLRGGGFVLIWVGLAMVLKPLSVVLDLVPLFGTLAEKAMGFLAGLIAFVLATSTVALAWLWYRPVLGIALFVSVIGAIVWLTRRAKASRPPPAPLATGPSMPPPPPPPPA